MATHSSTANPRNRTLRDLMSGGKVVARGYELHRGHLHGNTISFRNVVVEVIEAVVPSHVLPVPCAGADDVGEAVNSYIEWPRNDVLTSTLASSGSYDLSDTETPDFPDFSDSSTSSSETIASAPPNQPDSNTQNMISLVSGSVVVGRGYLVNRSSIHGKDVHLQNVAVQVVESVVPTHELPIACAGADNIKEAVGTFIEWPRKDIRYAASDVVPADAPASPVGVPSSPTSNIESVEAETDADEEIDPTVDLATRFARRIPSDDDEPPPSYSRTDLIDKQCHILHACNRAKYAEAIVLFTDPQDAIDDEFLGTERIGLCVGKVFPEMQTEDLRCHACAERPTENSLVQWENSDVILEDGRTIKQHLQAREAKDNEDMEMDFFEDNVEAQFKRKRKYTYTHRIPKEPKGKSKEERLCSTSSIKAFMKASCCKNTCTRKLTKGQVCDLRKEFYSQSCNARVTYFFDVLSVTYTGQTEDRIVVNGLEFCPTGWRMALGICQSTFYNWRKRFEAGGKIAQHGNTGSKKPRSATLATECVLDRFIQENAESLPHRSKRTRNDVRENVRKLPSILTKKAIYKEVGAVIEELTGTTIALNTYYRIWNREFSDVSIAKNSAFSKCNICVVIKQKLEKTKDTRERRNLAIQRHAHMLEQRSCRSQYWHWRALSHRSPENHLCIIHDKMDQVKTLVPRSHHLAKSVWRGDRLKSSLTGALTHGHGGRAYGHFSLDLWKDDSNFHVGSLSRILHKLELPQEDKLGDLCGSKPTDCKWMQAVKDITPLKNKLASTAESLPRSSSGMNPQVLNPLPRNLYLQLDNASGQNKNRFVFSYLSYLTWLKVFDEIQVGFMMVGHTHDDIDALFGNFSSLLRDSDALTLPELLYSFNNCNAKSPIPYFIDEVPNWKDFVKGFIPDKGQRLIGHTEPLIFKFKMVGDWPVMQYKMRPTHKEWLPADTPGIRMWKEDEHGKPMLPTGVPENIPPKTTLKDLPGLKDSINKYISLWKDICKNQEDSLFARQYMASVEYWSQLLISLENVAPGRPRNDAFWPKTRQGPPDQVAFVPEIDEAAVVTRPLPSYCGPSEGRPVLPVEEFEPHVHVLKGMFVLVRPGDENTATWLGYTEENAVIDPDSTHFGHIFVSWWKPTGGDYTNCLTKRWRPNPADPSRYERLDAIHYAWDVDGKRPKTVQIPKYIVDMWKDIAPSSSDS